MQFIRRHNMTRDTTRTPYNATSVICTLEITNLGVFEVSRTIASLTFDHSTQFILFLFVINWITPP